MRSWIKKSSGITSVLCRSIESSTAGDGVRAENSSGMLTWDFALA
jgi:hypothetical protein